MKRVFTNSCENMGHWMKKSKFMFQDSLSSDTQKYEKFSAALPKDDNNEDDDSTAQKGLKWTLLTSDPDTIGTQIGYHSHHATSEIVIIKGNIIILLSAGGVSTVDGTAMTSLKKTVINRQ